MEEGPHITDTRPGKGIRGQYKTQKHSWYKIIQERILRIQEELDKRTTIWHKKEERTINRVTV